LLIAPVFDEIVTIRHPDENRGLEKRLSQRTLDAGIRRHDEKRALTCLICFQVLRAIAERKMLQGAVSQPLHEIQQHGQAAASFEVVNLFSYCPQGIPRRQGRKVYDALVALVFFAGCDKACQAREVLPGKLAAGHEIGAYFYPLVGFIDIKNPRKRLPDLAFLEGLLQKIQ
jgi:hypothetical protein